MYQLLIFGYLPYVNERMIYTSETLQSAPLVILKSKLENNYKIHVYLLRNKLKLCQKYFVCH